MSILAFPVGRDGFAHVDQHDIRLLGGFQRSEIRVEAGRASRVDRRHFQRLARRQVARVDCEPASISSGTGQRP
jgi:hypothetical protein